MTALAIDKENSVFTENGNQLRAKMPYYHYHLILSMKKTR